MTYKLEAGGTNDFIMNGIPMQKGNYEIINGGTRFGLMRQNGSFLCSGEYTEFVDNNDSGFANSDAIVDYVKTFIFQ